MGNSLNPTGKRTNPRISCIAAIGLNRALGKDNGLIWHLPLDMKRFRKTTAGHAILMGRKTFESIGRALPNRLNIVISSKGISTKENVVVVSSIEKALTYAKQFEHEEIFIIGGAQIYTQSLDLCDRLYLTVVEDTPAADAYFPDYKMFGRVIYSEKIVDDSFQTTYFILEK